MAGANRAEMGWTNLEFRGGLDLPDACLAAILKSASSDVSPVLWQEITAVLG